MALSFLTPRKRNRRRERSSPWGTGRFVEDKDSKEKVKKKTFVKTTLKPGEHILYVKHAAREVAGEDEELVLVREEDVLGYRL